MQSFAIVAIVFGFATIALADDVVKSKVCLKTTEGCESAKALFHNIRALQIVDAKEDIPKYIGQLQDLFNITLRDECKVDICKCKDGELDCHTARDNIREVLQKVELPECLQESEKANAILAKFKKAIADKDREAILVALSELHEATINALAKSDNEVMVNCISETVQHVRTAVQKKINTLDIQETCDFCVKA